jgi:hypothetical protein
LCQAGYLQEFYKTDSKFIKWFTLPNEEKKDMIMRKCTMCSLNKPGKKSVLYVQLLVEHFAKLHVMANIRPRKTAKQAHNKNSVSFQSEILTLPLKKPLKINW